MYIQASVKIFGRWAVELAERWIDDDLSEVKNVVQLMVSRVAELVNSPDIEIQERVRPLSGFIQSYALRLMPAFRQRALYSYSGSFKLISTHTGRNLQRQDSRRPVLQYPLIRSQQLNHASLKVYISSNHCFHRMSSTPSLLRRRQASLSQKAWIWMRG